MKHQITSIIASGSTCIACVLAPGVSVAQQLDDRHEWELALSATGIFPGGNSYSGLGFGPGIEISGAYRATTRWYLRAALDYLKHACAESGDAIPYETSTEIGCSYFSVGIGPVYRPMADAASLTPFLGGQLDFIEDLSNDGFGFGVGATTGLILKLRRRIGVRSALSGKLARLRRVSKYWSSLDGWQETRTWQWGRSISFSVGAQVSIR